MVAVAASLTAVGGVLGVPTSGPSPPDAPMTAADSFAADLATTGGDRDPNPNTGPERATSAEPAAPMPDSAGAGSTPSAETSPDRDRRQRAAVLAVRETGRLGPVVVDGDGFTLYRYDGDGAGASTCADACASTWPPAIVDPTARLVVDGIEATNVGLVRRGDGAVQLTIGGWPVYRFAGDTRPGRDAGQGIGGAWFAVTPTGEKANAP